MSSPIHYTTCPACDSSEIRRVLASKDHTVSQKMFEIWECSRCTMRFTQDAPQQDDIAAYYQSEDYISHSNTSKGLVNRLYLRVRERSLKNKRKLVQSYTNAESMPRLLDVGCGIGAFMDHMRQFGWLVEGVEPSETARENAVKQYGLYVYPPDKFFDNSFGDFDVITMWHVLEHVHLLNEYMDRLKELLRPQGTLFIAVPNYTSYDAGKYKEHWAAYDVPRHLYHFSPDSMRLLLEKHGLKLRAVKPMWFDSFYVSMLSEKYKTGKDSVLKGGIMGSISNLNTLFHKEQCSSLIYVIGE
ncbi:class I SAM-dependent methyltransferase [Longitalea luteola]|uniref:class I SAM-dependent methyltransferase n=1 Tax=Longitalea luteola TaxID=2812563 RepID=UPI001A95E092|nr:class I SAM-dependent methyltransferase [Longitalea luteola]